MFSFPDETPRFILFSPVNEEGRTKQPTKEKKKPIGMQMKKHAASFLVKFSLVFPFSYPQLRFLRWGEEIDIERDTSSYFLKQSEQQQSPDYE
jgi:hypothetical protein